MLSPNQNIKCSMSYFLQGRKYKAVHLAPLKSRLFIYFGVKSLASYFPCRRLCVCEIQNCL